MVGDESSEHRSFPSTKWSQVFIAADADSPGGREALAIVIRRYQPALKTYLVRRKGIKSDRADDLLQSFVTTKVLEGNLLDHADQQKGKFRTFLLTALSNFVISEYRREHAKKRSPTRFETIEPGTELPEEQIDPARVFEVAWARQVLEQAIDQMRDECDRNERVDVWGVFEGRILGPTLYQNELLPYEVMVRRFGFSSPAQDSNVLTTAKRMFDRHLRSVIREYAGDEGIDSEIADLQRILSAARTIE